MVEVTQKQTNNLHKNTAIKVLVILALINLLNQVDRRALVTVFPLLQSQWMLTDTQLGVIVSLFTLARTLVSLPSAWVADRIGIIKTLRPLTFFWSLMVTISGLVSSFFAFTLFRFLAGIGDGGNGPLDQTLLAHVSPRDKKGTILSIYSIALYAGSAIGIMSSGYIAECFGWRWVFIIPGLLGIIAAALFMLLRIPNTENEASFAQTTSFKNLKILSKKPFPIIFIAAGFGVFASTALVSWLPTYWVRQIGMTITQAGLITGGVILPASILGTLTGGIISDRLFSKWRLDRSFISGISLILAALFGFFGLSANTTTLAIFAYFLTGFFITIPVSPLIIKVQAAAPKNQQASTLAIFGLFTQIFGAAPATAVIGYISDQVNLVTALILPLLFCGLGGLLLFIQARR